MEEVLFLLCSPVLSYSLPGDLLAHCGVPFSLLSPSLGLIWTTRFKVCGLGKGKLQDCLLFFPLHFFFLQKKLMKMGWKSFWLYRNLEVGHVMWTLAPCGILWLWGFKNISHFQRGEGSPSSSWLFFLWLLWLYTDSIKMVQRVLGWALSFWGKSGTRRTKMVRWSWRGKWGSKGSV